MSASPVEGMEKAKVRFLAATPKSCELAAEARDNLPGGISRAGMPSPLYPVFIDHAEGQYLYDIDGNRVLDLSNGHSSLPLGHARPEMIEAVIAQTRNGLGFGLMSPTEVELARMLRERIPSMERVRFTASGTEATMFAVRLARAFTGRLLFGRMVGSYHGMHDMMCSGPGMNVGYSWQNTGNDPVSNGVHPSIREGVVFLPFNDLGACERIVAERADEMAAIIIEPILGGGGCIPAEPDFLQGLRRLCDRHGVLLIFDEMISIGLARGGAQEYFGVRADLTATGKLVGGGMPMGVFGGREDVMSMMAPRADGTLLFFHTGTWNGHPLAMAAGIAQLDKLDDDAFAYLGDLGDTMRRKVRDLAERMDVALQVTGLQHFSAFHYTDQPVRNRQDALRSDQVLAQRVAFSLMSQGFFMLGGRSNLSTAITLENIDDFIGALAIAFEEAGARRAARSR